MFNKKKCSKCKSKINKDFDFCPYCGNRFDSNEDWGMLGKNDFTQQNQDPFQNIFGGGMLNKMLGSAMKMLEKEMQKEMNKPQEQSRPNSNFELYINGKKINPKNIQVTRQPMNQSKRQIQKHPTMPQTEFSEANLKKLAKLPRKEPTTDIKRLADKIIYEIKVPGVKSVNDVSIVQLENSIEVKAISKTKVYSKLIPVSLPIINYKLEKNILVLELANRG